MRVSPLDIRKQEFTRVFRGYEVEEVEAFLQMLSTEWEEMRDEHRRLEEQVRGLEGKIRHYERVEEALQEALQTARDSSRKTVENAEERARNIVRSAESKAAEIEGDAVARRDRLRQENSRLLNRRHELVARLRAFLTSEMEMLERFEGNDIVGTLSAEVESEQPVPTSDTRDAWPKDEDEFDDALDESAELEDHRLEQPAFERRGTFNVRPLVNRVEDELDWGEEPAHGGDAAGGVDEPDLEHEFDHDTEEQAAEDREKTKARQATEEIEKIRRILNDLD